MNGMGKKGRLALVMFALLALMIGLLVFVLQSDPGNGANSAGRADTVSGNDPELRGPSGPLGVEPRLQRTGEGRLSGRLLSQNDRQPVAGQKVLLHISGQDPLETLTDERGLFTFDRLPRRVALRLEVVAPQLGFISIPGIRLKRQRTRDLGDLLLAPSSRVTVFVTSWQGKPVVGARVHAYRLGTGAAEFAADATPEAVASIATNAEGEALFPRLSVGQWNFVVIARGHARRATGAWEMHAGAGERKFEVTLDAATALTGVVSDGSGRALSGVTVVALRRTVTANSTNAPLAARTTTDGAGTYHFDSLPSADLVLWAARPGEPLAVAAAVRVPGVERFDLSLPDAAVLRGTLQDQERSPLARADIEATIQLDNRLTITAHAITDKDGWYGLTFPRAGRVTAFSITKADYFLPTGDTPVGVRLFEGDAHEAHLVATRGTTIEGVVRGAEGPVVGAWVVTGEGTALRESMTDGAGFYQLHGVVGTDVRLRAELWGYSDGRIGPEFAALSNLTPGRTVVVDLHMERGQPIHGVVVDAGGRPLRGAEVYVDGYADGWRVRTDATGKFTLPAASPGQTITLGAKAKGFTPGYGRVTTAASGPTRNARISMRPLTTVRGRLRSSNGEPLQNAYVQVAGHGGGRVDPIALEWAWLSFERWAVQPDGTFEHPAPIADSGFVVRASAAGHAPQSSERVALSAGRSDYAVDLVLEAGGALSGRVVADGSVPVAGAHITLVERPSGTTTTNWTYPGALGPATAAVTDRHGGFSVDRLPRGTYGVEVTHPDYRTRRVVAEVPDTGFSIQLQARHRISGRVIDADSRPAKFGELVLKAKDGTVARRVRCDGAGRFDMEFPTAGSFDAELHMTRDGGEVEKMPCGPVLTGRIGVVLEARRD